MKKSEKTLKIDEKPLKITEFGPIYRIPGWYYGIVVLIYIFNILDAGFTAIFVGDGHAIEMNPIMDSLMGLGYEYFLSTKLMLGSTGAWAQLALGALKKLRWITYIFFIIFSLLISYYIYGMICVFL